MKALIQRVMNAKVTGKLVHELRLTIKHFFYYSKQQII